MKILPFAITATVMFLASGVVSAQDHKLDISLETGPNHVRNLAIVKLAEELEEASGGRLEVRVFHGASKYKGSAVPTALAQGALDMGMPGTWHLGKFVPEFNIAGLPFLYGVRRDQQYKVWDGDVGAELTRRLEEKLKVKVIGRWIDLGYGQMFFINKQVKSHKDLVGLRMRAPGGASTLARYEGFGSNAIKIAWPDVPQALQRGTVDGLMATHESVRSAKLWDSGIKYAYDDYQGFYQYVPVISMRAWERLPSDIRKIIVDTWESKVDDIRKFAEERQASARVEGAKNGIARTDASPEDLAAMRKTLLATQDNLVTKLRIDPKLVNQAMSAIK